MSLTLQADAQRLRTLKGTLVYSATFEAKMRATKSYKATIQFDVSLSASAVVVHQYVLSATLRINPVLMANMKMTYNERVTISIAPEITMSPYIGPYWAKDESGSNWIPETLPGDIWVPEIVPPKPWG
jgi:hypothetical protein